MIAKALFASHLSTSGAGRLLPFGPALRLCLGLVCALALLSPAPDASAHGGNPAYRSVIDRVEPPVRGIEVEVIDYDADLRLTAPPGVEIEVPGYEGEPYVRILADGSVQVNRHSPSAYLNTERYGNVELPASADAKATPEWQTEREDGVFQWHDHRSHWMSPEPPERIRGASGRTKVFDYEIPIRVDGQPATIQGTLYWVGEPDSSKLPFILAGAAVLLLGGAVTLFARRRQEGDRPALKDDNRDTDY